MERPGSIEGEAVGDETSLSFLYNQDDLGPAIRLAFEERKEHSFMQKIDHFVAKREAQIEEICNEHFQEFIKSVDDLLAVRNEAADLAAEIAQQNDTLQKTGVVLIEESENLIRYQKIQRNIASVQRMMKLCLQAVNLCVETKELVDAKRLSDAFKALDQLEKDLLPRLAQFTVARSLAEVYIPKLKEDIKNTARKEFLDWLIRVREASKNVGRSVMTQVLNMQKILRNANKEDESSALQATVEVFDKQMEVNILEQQNIDLTVVHRCVYIYTNLNALDEFRALYRDNRKSQAQVVMQPMNLQSFPTNFQDCFETILGFFVIEDEVLKSTEGLMSYVTADTLWDVFNSRIIALLKETLPNCQKHDVLLKIKTSAFAFCRAMGNYGFKVRAILEILDATQEKYSDMIAIEHQKELMKVFAEDKFEPFTVASTKEYDKLIGSFGIDPEEDNLKFPRTFPFSRMVPYGCQVIQSYIRETLRYAGQDTELYEALRKSADRFITSVLCKYLADIIAMDYRQQHVSQLAQIYLNCHIFADKACTFFEETHLKDRNSLTPHRLSNSRRTFREIQFKAEQMIVYCMQKKTDDFLMLAEDIDWAPKSVSPGAHDFIEDLCNYLVTAFISLAYFENTVQEAICVQIFKHIQTTFMKQFLGPSVRAYTPQGVASFQKDVIALEELSGRLSFPHLKDCFTEARQYSTILLNPGDILSEYRANMAKYSKVEFNFLNSVVSRIVVGSVPIIQSTSTPTSPGQSQKSSQSKGFSRFFGSK
eukprot:TRINITY_DN8465_c0_g2_i1.p1 TRINITY_DN8465_c0_g2~~TRINITY_DN8465_c0_g2_i1.p1  ORF type:complete len:765 (+),score=136.38 TRINITY_DN8465_c0_g2_i1:87-2381(+)